MLKDSCNILQTIKSKNGKLSFDNISDNLIENFINELMSKNDYNLIRMAFSPNPAQSELDEFLKNWDIEVAGSHKALILAYFMKLHPQLNYPEYVGPRLKGLLSFYKFQNMRLFSHFTKICNKLKQENIQVMLLKGGAMKYLRPEFPRVMGDIDILVKENVYKKAVKLVSQMGYDCAWDIHSVDIHLKGTDEGIMDIHKYIYMQTGYETSINNDLFERAQSANVFGIEAKVPSMEDMLFIALVNMTRNLTNKTSWSGVLFTLFDCSFLLNSKPDFNWDIVVENARKTKTETQVCFATMLINKIVPELLPMKLRTSPLFEKEVNDYCLLLMYQRFFLWNMKQKGHELKLADAFSSFNNFIEYIKLKPKYFILKLFIFRKNPKMAKMILKFNEKHPLV